MAIQTTYEDYPQRVPDSGLHPVEEPQYPKEAQQYTYPHGENTNSQEPYHQQATGVSVKTDNQGDKLQRRIGGLKPWVFWLLIIAIGVIIVGASVGGAVGGARAAKGSSASPVSLTSVIATQTPASSSATSQTLASSPTTSQPTSTPTSIVTTDCPSSNGSPVTPETFGGGGGKYRFIKYCDREVDGSDLISAFVPNFDACIALCSNWNYIQTGSLCTAASFRVSGTLPSNCWAKNGTSLVTSDIQAVALLQDAK